MTRLRLSAQRARMVPAALVAAALMIAPGAAQAQDRSGGGFLDNLFNRDRDRQQPAPPPQQPPVQQAPPAMAQTGGDNDVNVRVDRIENALRQLTGTIEQLQHQNQMLQMQLQRMQDDTEYRFQQLGAKGGGGAPLRAPVTMPPPAGGPNGQRSDVFNPAQHPEAPGAPRTLGNPQIAAPEPQGQNAPNDQPVGAPGGREAGAPLDLSTLAGNAPSEPQPPAPVANAAPMPPPQQMPNAPTGQLPPPQTGQLPPPPSRNTSATGVQLATLPPSASPKDEYQLAYGYVLHKDYVLRGGRRRKTCQRCSALSKY